MRRREACGDNSDLVTVGVSWEEPYASSRNSGSVRSLDCRAPATAGELTIPSALLELFGYALSQSVWLNGSVVRAATVREAGVGSKADVAG